MPTPHELLNLTSGARWLKVDLHIHTPASSDIADDWKCATPEDAVRIAIEKELDVIGITDHNTAAWCDDVRNAADGTALTVLPGVEISTPQGHLLAVFDSDIAASHIEDLLIAVGIPREKFGSLDIATEEGIVGVSATITRFGGVAIAAHADANRGFLKMIPVGAERQRAYQSEDLWAIEILDPSSKQDHQSGKFYPRNMTCLQSSDCWGKGADHHQLDGMAYRYSFLKMDERSLSGLKLALIDPDIRVRLADDESLTVNCSILGMWITNGFLDGQQIRFNDNVSCFIGDTGSGKSVAIELLRFGLDQQPGVSKILKEVDSLLKQQLGNLGTVHILLAKGDSYYLVERTWGAPPEKPFVQRLTEAGLQQVDELDMRLFFPIKCFSQSEIIEFAREPEVRLSLTDDLIDCSSELLSIRDLKVALRENASSITTEQARESNIRGQLAERPGLQEEVQRIDTILTDARVTQQQLWYGEEKLLNDAKQKADQLKEQVTKLAAPLEVIPAWPDEMDTLPNQDLLEKVRSAYKDWGAHVVEIQSGAKDKVNALVNELGALREQWDGRFNKAEAEYQLILEQLDQAGVGLQALSDRRKNIQERISALDDINKNLQGEVEPRIQNLKTERDGLLTKLQDQRRAITKKRQDKAKDLSKKLSHKIRLNVHARANTEAFRTCLRTPEYVMLRLLPRQGNHVSFLSQRHQPGAICFGSADFADGPTPDQAPHRRLVRCFSWGAVCFEKRLSMAHAARRPSPVANLLQILPAME